MSPWFSLPQRCASLFWWFDVLNVFLGGLLGGTIFSGIQTFLNDPSAIWEVLGQVSRLGLEGGCFRSGDGCCP